MDIHSINAKREDFIMHLMQHLPHHLRKHIHLSRLTYERTPARHNLKSAYWCWQWYADGLEIDTLSIELINKNNY